MRLIKFCTEWEVQGVHVDRAYGMHWPISDLLLERDLLTLDPWYTERAYCYYIEQSENGQRAVCAGEITRVRRCL